MPAHRAQEEEADEPHYGRRTLTARDAQLSLNPCYTPKPTDSAVNGLRASQAEVRANSSLARWSPAGCGQYCPNKAQAGDVTSGQPKMLGDTAGHCEILRSCG